MRPIAITSALTALTAAAGTVGTDPSSGWYDSVDKPDWQPPGEAFPIVWTPIYCSIARATGRAVEKAPPEARRRLWALIGADLALNAGWCWAFFHAQNPRAGLVTIVALDAANLALVREVAKADRLAGAALLPYAAWTGFATALNASIWRRNR